MPGLKPSQPPPKWTHSAEEITTLVNAAIEKMKIVLDQVGSLADKD